MTFLGFYLAPIYIFLAFVVYFIITCIVVATTYLFPLWIFITTQALFTLLILLNGSYNLYIDHSDIASLWVGGLLAGLIITYLLPSKPLSAENIKALTLLRTKEELYVLGAFVCICIAVKYILGSAYTPLTVPADKATAGCDLIVLGIMAGGFLTRFVTTIVEYRNVQRTKKTI